MRSILNLTRDKEKLKKFFEFLENVTSQTEFQQCMDIIFEKALNEPGFSEVAARLCRELRSRGDTRDQSFMYQIDFSALMIRK